MGIGIQVIGHGEGRAALINLQRSMYSVLPHLGWFASLLCTKVYSRTPAPQFLRCISWS